MLITKYEQTYLQKSSRTINDSFQHRLNDKHDDVHFQQKLQYIHEGQFLR